MRDAAGDAEAIKYYGIAGQRVALSGPDGMQYLLTNHLGSVSAVLDAAGHLLAEQRYTPFGEARFDVTLGTTDFGYTGQRVLAGIGLMDYNARFYAPALGRWTQPDTIVPGTGNPQALSRFTYVLNSPVNLVDPTGHIPNEWDNPCIDGAFCGRSYGVSVARANFSMVSGGMGAPYSSGGVDEGNTATDGVINLLEAINDGLSDCASSTWLCEAYATRASNYAMALVILNHENAGFWQKAGVSAILAIDLAAHLTLLYALQACIAAPMVCFAAGAKTSAINTSVGLGTAACRDGDCTNEIRTGVNIVYQGWVNGQRYIGITKDFTTRSLYWARQGMTIERIPGLGNLSRTDARAAEQVLIDYYGLSNLRNSINSIAVSNPIYPGAIMRGQQILNAIGWAP